MKQVILIDLLEWDELVSTTYGRPYSFQQQDGCRERGIFSLSVPIQDPEDFENTTIPEEVGSEEMGVSFKAWLERDPKQLITEEDTRSSFLLNLWWERNFYPSVEMVANDLNKKGLLPDGDYRIDIDW